MWVIERLAERLRDNFLVSPDGFLATFGHATPPLKQQAGRNAMKPGDGRDRHARLHGPI
jgi:hypothetical protein